MALGLSGTGLATVQYALSMSSPQPIITPTMLRRQVLLTQLYPTVLVNGLQEASEDGRRPPEDHRRGAREARVPAPDIGGREFDFRTYSLSITEIQDFG